MKKIEVGQTWKTVGGKVVHVTKACREYQHYVTLDANSHARYTVGQKGRVDGHYRSERPSELYDLAELMPRVYIAGPMSGLDQLNFPAFNAAAKLYRDRGCFVLNPAEISPEQPDTTGWTPEQSFAFWQACMRKDIPQLMTCEMIVMLPGWENSKGATLEYNIAYAMGHAITYISEF